MQEEAVHSNFATVISRSFLAAYSKMLRHACTTTMSSIVGVYVCNTIVRIVLFFRETYTFKDNARSCRKARQQTPQTRLL
jgi:hypothetical protein